MRSLVCQGVDPTAARLAMEQLVADEQQRAADHEAGRRAALDAVLEEVDAEDPDTWPSEDGP